MADKKMIVILALLALLVIAGVGWFNAGQPLTHENIYDNTYSWTAIFHGYEAYLDQRISYVANIQGTSMEPTFGENDVILYVVANPAELKVGDIIVFYQPTLPNPPAIAHRIIETRLQNETYSFRTRGDNMLGPDQHWVPQEKIIGLVIGAIYGATQ